MKYPEGSTLPPRSEDHILQYVAIFNVAGTAQNYVRHVRWACSELGLDGGWYTDRVKQQVKGLAKFQIRMELDRGPRCYLTSVIVRQLAKVANSMGDLAFAMLVMICWHGLLRVQSEAVELQVGSAETVLTLPPDRHSAVYVDGSRVLHIRLK